MMLMVCLPPFLLLLAAFFASAAGAAKSCSAFSVNGSYATTFSFYRFYDFRNLSTTEEMSPSTGSWESNSSDTSASLQLSQSVNDSAWQDDWTVRVQYRGAANENMTALHYVPQNVFIGSQDNSAHLTLNTSRLRNETQRGGEMYFNQADVHAVSLRVCARVRGDSGAVAGFFTYYNDTQESDIEVRTRDSSDTVHFSNQPTTDSNDEAVRGASYNASLGRSRGDWTVYRMDWLADHGVTVWYVDGRERQQTRTNVPRLPSTIFVDMWSNGGSWSGDMVVGGQAALEIRWIEMAFNASSAAAADGGGVPEGGVICTIDEELGKPVEASATANGPAPRALVVWAAAAVAWWLAAWVHI